MRNRIFAKFLVACGVFLLVAGCAASHFFTVTIYEGPNRVVKLQVVPDANDGEGFSHPADIPEERLAAVMRGLQIEIENSPFSIPFLGKFKEVRRRRVFSEAEIKFFAPQFVKGLAQATPEERITFYENAEVSDFYELTTSGGVYVKDEEIHFLISNFNVQTQIWQDNEQYKAPYHLRPMKPIDPEPGRLLFDPPNLMVESKSRLFSIGFTAEPFEVGVRWKELR